MIASKYFVVSGSAMSKTSHLNAFDAALEAASISQCNLVAVSSTLPADASRVDPIEIIPGTITFCVLSRMSGKSEDTIGAAIGWSQCTGNDKQSGIVTEDCGNKDSDSLEADIGLKLSEMAHIRGLRLGKIESRTEVMKVPKGCFGSVVAVLVYVFD